MKKIIKSAIIAILMFLPVCINAQVICKVPGGNVEIQSEYKSNEGYVENVMNDSSTDSANVRITISYKVGKETRTSTGSGIALRSRTTKIVVPCASDATDIQITSISGTKCEK